MTYMFDVTCPRHGHRVLLFADQIRLENTPHGIEVHWTCSCGATGVELVGALAADRPAAPARTTAAAPTTEVEAEPAGPGPHHVETAA